MSYNGLKYNILDSYSTSWLQEHLHEALRHEGYELVPFWELEKALQWKHATEYPSSWQYLSNGSQWLPIYCQSFSSPLSWNMWIVRRPLPQQTASKPKPEDEHTRMMRFFFGVGPSDPDKLPGPPKQFGLTNDSIWDVD